MLLENLRSRFTSRRASPAPTAADAEVAALQARYVAWRDYPNSEGRSPWPPTAPRVFDTEGIPDIAAADLDAAALADGLLNHGAVIVRGLISEEAAAGFRDGIDYVDGLAAAQRDGNPVDVTAGGSAAWRAELTAPDTGEAVGASGRRYNTYYAGSLPAADSPHLALQLLEIYRETGLTGLIEDYLGEPPAATLEKWVLRRVPPDTNTSWHQDGAFIGTDVRAVNVWIALSDCGEEASGLDIVAKKFDEIVPTGTEGAYFHWDVSPAMVDEVRGEQEIVSPVFAPGDAVIFDQFLLHRTGVKPGMSKDRYAVETWFFAPSHFPAEYNGILA